MSPNGPPCDSVGEVLPAIAQRQSIDALEQSRSFREFEGSLQRALLDLGVVERTGR